MKKIALHIVLLILLSFQSKAQQDPMYSMYVFDDVLINPGYAGSAPIIINTLKYRNQFNGLTGNPVTQTFNMHSPIQSLNMGVGGKIVNDKIGIQNTLTATALASYHLNFAHGKLSFGLEGGIQQRRLDFQKLITASLNDAALPTTQKSSMVPDFNWGIYYHKREFYAGFSQYHLIKKKFNYGVVDNSHLYNHMYFITGQLFDLSEKLSIEPNILVKYQPKNAMQFDINLIAYYNEKVAFGLQYRTKDAVSFLFKVAFLQDLRFAYSYDYNFSKLSGYSKGAHEIMLSYGINLPPPATKKEIHPRYYF